MEICKNPEIAAQATLGPIEDFGFDAAILFSDLLFFWLGWPGRVSGGRTQVASMRSSSDICRGLER